MKLNAKHRISFECSGLFDLAVVTITDPVKAAEAIHEMLYFWTGAEQAIDQEGGDELKAWLKKLGAFILNERCIPDGKYDGWAPLDGTYGILVEEDEEVFFVPEDIEVAELAGKEAV
jgi:hypothetical protein